MVKDKAEQLENFLREVLAENGGSGELRLSEDECNHLEGKYPQICFKRMNIRQCSDGKHWYKAEKWRGVNIG